MAKIGTGGERSGRLLPLHRSAWLACFGPGLHLGIGLGPRPGLLLGLLGFDPRPKLLRLEWEVNQDLGAVDARLVPAAMG